MLVITMTMMAMAMMMTTDDDDDDIDDAAAADDDALCWVTIMVKLHACRSLTSGDDEIKIFAPLLQPHPPPFYLR